MLSLSVRAEIFLREDMKFSTCLMFVVIAVFALCVFNVQGVCIHTLICVCVICGGVPSTDLSNNSGFITT